MAKGTKKITQSGLIDSTNAVVVYTLHAVATSGGASLVTLNNGGSGGAATIQLDVAAASKGATLDFANGVTLATSGGGYVTFDSNTSYVTVVYERLV